MVQYERKAEIQEQAEFEESSPLKKAVIRKLQHRRTIFK